MRTLAGEGSLPYAPAGAFHDPGPVPGSLFEVAGSCDSRHPLVRGIYPLLPYRITRIVPLDDALRGHQRPSRARFGWVESFQDSFKKGFPEGVRQFDAEAFRPNQPTRLVRSSLPSAHAG